MSDEYMQAPTSSNKQQAMLIDIVTLFPGMFVGPFGESMIARAREAGLIDVRIHDLRRWTDDRHRTTDDYAYGGGGGMVMIAGPLFRAVEDLLQLPPSSSQAPAKPATPVVLMTPQGSRLDHQLASDLAEHDRLVVLCGHYEGVDERVREHLVTHEVSVGDFVVTGGELPAMLLTDGVARLRPGVLGLKSAAECDSFARGVLEHPHYSRPADFRGWAVPDVLLSGHHAEIERWRRRESLRRTLRRRPDQLDEAQVTDEEREWLADLSGRDDDPRE